MVEQSIQLTNGGSNPTSSLQLPELYLEFCSSGDQRYVDIRSRHYVESKGTHGQQIHFLVWHKGAIAGIISGSSGVYATPVRDRFFKITSENREKVLRGIINNVVFRLEVTEKNLATKVLSQWRKIIAPIWEDIYGVEVFGFETLVLIDRTKILEGGFGSLPGQEIQTTGDFKSSSGTLYKADNWSYAGMTEGNTKHHEGSGLNESFQRREVKPKAVWCKWRDGFSEPIKSETTATWQASVKWNETSARRLSRAFPNLTQEIWETEMQPLLKKRAKELADKRKFYLGSKFFVRGKNVLQAL